MFLFPYKNLNDDKCLQDLSSKKMQKNKHKLESIFKKEGKRKARKS
jgi:hypothetical protein